MLFEGAALRDVSELLADECADNLPFHDDATPESLERIRYACLKLSDGLPGKLLDAIQEAQIDWRDVLMTAGFGHDTRAHASWWPQP